MDTSYIAPFIDYNITEADGGDEAALRLTFVGVDYLRRVPATARAIASMFAAKPASSPSVLYVSCSVWWKDDEARDGPEPVASIVAGLREMAAAIPHPRRLIFGTILSLRVRRHNDTFTNPFESALLELLPRPTWTVFWRDSKLAQRATMDGSLGVCFTSSHAPHLINWVDAQRLLMSTAQRKHAPGSASCVPPPATEVRLSPQCAGLNVSAAFIGAWLAYCRIGPAGP